MNSADRKSVLTSSRLRNAFSRWNKKSLPLLLIIPALISIGLTTIYPLAFSFRLSFFNYNIAKPDSGQVFVGLKNYATALTDANFYTTLKTTLLFVALAVSVEFLVGLGLAVLLNRSIGEMRLISSLLLTPVVLAPVAVGVMWRLLFNPGAGAINYLIRLLHLGKGPLWVGDPRLALFSVVLVDVWEASPFIMLVLLAGLKSLPVDPYEAAVVDGASGWQAFRHITLPLLQPIILIVLLFRITDAIRIFDTLFILTGGGPAGVTETLSIYIYKTGFKFYNLGYASALAFLMLFLIGVITWANVRMLSTQMET